MRQLPLSIPLRAAATFDSYAPGPNTEALAALRGPGTAPLWLWGGPGSGKTHLLQAACAAAGAPGAAGAAGASGAAAAYFPLDRGLQLPPEALLGFESCGLLCLDDADAVAGDPAWEQALFRVFNAAAELNTRLIFAAAAAPRALDWRLGDWGSRAAACVVYQLRGLDQAGLVEALRLRAAERGLDLPQETCDYLLRRMPRDLPSLLGLLDHLDEASLIAQRRLTVPFIRDALERLAGTAP
jgi:DnaA family protein